MRTGNVFRALVVGLVSFGLFFSMGAPAWASHRSSIEVDIGLFYDDLAPYGQWVEVEDHGWCWAPRVHRTWRPYTVGHWVWTEDYGWLWVSDEDYGWAVYHYGRWYQDPVYDWVWVPGYEWGPSWVSWRYGGGYVGWAPLPPRATWSVGFGFRSGGAAFDAYIQPRAYTFVPERSFVDTRVYRRALPVERNTVFVNATRNVTDYRIDRDRVVNRGVSIDRIERETRRHVPRQRVRDVDSVREARRGHDKGDAVAVFRPVVRPQAEKTPPRGKALGRRGREAPEDRAGLSQREQDERERRQMQQRREAEERDSQKSLAHGREQEERRLRQIEEKRAADQRDTQRRLARQREQQEDERRMIAKRRETEEREAQKRQALEREQHERHRQELEGRQARQRDDMERQHSKDIKKRTDMADVDRRQEQEHRAIEERQHRERQQMETARQQAREQREARAAAERRTAESKAENRADRSGKKKDKKEKPKDREHDKDRPERH